MVVPWRDRRGKFLPFKAAVLAVLPVPGLLYAFWWATEALGARPLNEVIHGTGLWAIRLLMISLAITPLARLLEWPRLLTVRRMVGVSALSYAAVHLSLYALDQKFVLSVIASEIVHRFYLTIGFVALLGLIALGATSTDNAMRLLGRNWKRLHRLAYPIAAIATLHYFIQSKANVSEPVFVAGLFVWMMLWRALPEVWRRRIIVYPLLAVVAGCAAAAIEFTWYGAATAINPWRVLAANESIAFGLRPAHWVFVVALGIALLMVARRVRLPRLPARVSSTGNAGA